MYERFTDRARKVMQLANQAAMQLNHEYIGTEHILLGLVREGAGVARAVAVRVGTTLDHVGLRVKELAGPGVAQPQVVVGRLPHTPGAKTVIELALAAARELGHNYVGTEHLLLGLCRQANGLAAKSLAEFGLTADRVRAEVVSLLDTPTDSAKPADPLTAKFVTHVLRYAGESNESVAAGGGEPAGMPAPDSWLPTASPPDQPANPAPPSLPPFTAEDARRLSEEGAAKTVDRLFALACERVREACDGGERFIDLGQDFRHRPVRVRHAVRERLTAAGFSVFEGDDMWRVGWRDGNGD